jgi:hypothetical protein
VTLLPCDDVLPTDQSEPVDGSEQKNLGDRVQRILDFERQWSCHVPAKEEAINDEFGFSAARYYQVLGAVIDTSAALTYDPLLVKRLLRMRDARASARVVRAFHA